VIRALTLVGLLLTLLLAALDQTIVATALPRITGELGGLNHYAWVTTAYLLTSTVMVPIAGKLSDQLGRKPLLVGGSVAFLATSLLCAQAQTFSQLIGARALQGIGGGTITAAVFATVPTLFSAAGRARVVGLFTGTYGLASIIGPLVGGIITDSVGWRGVFYINLPIGIIALGLVIGAYRARMLPARAHIDFKGALTLVGGLVALLLAISLAGHELDWTSPSLYVLVVLGGLLLIAFVRIETTAAEPIIPLQLIRSRDVGIATIGMLFLSAGIFATSLLTPLFVQNVIGSSATRSGSVLAPMMLAFVAASVLVGQLIARLPRYRTVGTIGLLGGAAGAWLMAGMGPQTDYAVVARNLAVVGFGLGGALCAFAIASQNAVPIAQMGVATALGTSGRAIGSTLASAGFGSLFTARLGGNVLSPLVLAGALHDTFQAAAVVLCVGALLALFLKEAPLRPRAAFISIPVPGRIPAR
jgi:EmrB/QacA subfamily drug resistance transporter